MQHNNYHRTNDFSFCNAKRETQLIVCQPYQYKNSARKVWICRDFFVTLQGNKSSYMMENKGLKSPSTPVPCCSS